MTEQILTMGSTRSTQQAENPPHERSKREQELHEAIERVWRRYGKDLPAFQRDAERELEKRSEEEELHD